MPSGSLIVLALSLFVGVLLVALGVPLALNRVPPNMWYGFRMGRTLEDEKAWSAANGASGRWLVFAGAAVLLASVINALAGTLPAIAALVNGLVLTVGIITAIGAGFAAMNAQDFPPS